jgi:hypothetical protein
VQSGRPEGGVVMDMMHVVQREHDVSRVAENLARWQTEDMSTKGFVIAAAVAATGLGLAAQAQKPAAPHVVVYKTSTCGCCHNWVAHLRQNGFSVEAHDVAQARLNQMGGEVGITQDLASCHTARVDGYYVEGHVPAADIRKMLKERPKITGIAAPGMPIGSPGMEQGGAKDPYDVVAFTKGGPTTVYVRHR